ncbi:MAG TPA: ANTAR domain-containing protein [Streptosporangiaceae bacterium]|nr:ANTAR domain-containing protein [Streptosporangiaceae bacterium]HYA51026.1 ANTAR domain-containing protein [Streptosporangiaceae bacterium]
MERRSGDSEPTARNSSGAAQLEIYAQVQGFEEAEAPPPAIPGPPPMNRPRWEILHEALEAARAENRAQAQRLEAAKAQLRATAEWIETRRPQREVLRESAIARLQARLESLPVIEQAKGILMAQQRCGPEEAFDLLRRASQRANVKVHVLAAQIVARAASPPAEATAQPTQRPASTPP